MEVATYINAQGVCELLHKVAALEVGVPITLVPAGARDQKYRLVQELGGELDIELLYLPSYSPKGNLIERLWKFVQKKTLNAKSYENSAAFKAAIITCIAEAPTKHKAELDSLLGSGLVAALPIQDPPADSACSIHRQPIGHDSRFRRRRGGTERAPLHGPFQYSSSNAYAPPAQQLPQMPTGPVFAGAPGVDGRQRNEIDGKNTVAARAPFWLAPAPPRA